jgi:hypothetical protein
VTGVESNRNVVPITLEQVCARGVKREHARPIVRALPMPTAHPLAEAWSAAGRDAGARRVLAGTPARAAPRCTGTEHKPSTAVVKKSEPNRLTRGAQDRSARFACLEQG